jgi:hypothetical protein
MNDFFDSTFWEWMERGAVVLSYAVLLSLFAFLVDLWSKLRKARRLAEISGYTDRPRALALSHGGGSIRTDVENYLKKVYPNKTIPIEEHVAGELTPHKVQAVIQALKEIKDRYHAEGITELHLFLKTTTAIATAAGVIFDNWRAVKVYQLDRNTNEYQPWLILSQAKSLPFTNLIEESAIDLLNRTIPGAKDKPSDPGVTSASNPT